MLLSVVDEMAAGGNDQQEEAAAASADDPTQEDWSPAPKKARNESLQDMYQEILAENDIIKQATTGETASQVHAYLGKVTILKKECPLKYWKSNQMRFPALARVTRKYSTAPCTSVDSERLFSAVSHVIDEKRNRTQQMPDPPQLTPLDAKEAAASLLRAPPECDRASHPISKGVPAQPPCGGNSFRPLVSA
ncbi:hypothetical protein L3Q82_005901 [Scortum barcoo]|uniref:Uncharacterized protein n=1 Tax=Scortum barcoo TaxID=214431 RepID=A0ACB8V6Y6_9TELE|nr:hypothetical protein L3Q82_005901 [Scortum barcoo]